jgi:hypothetical protein
MWQEVLRPRNARAPDGGACACPNLQALPDYALAAAGGRVVAHSELTKAGQPAWFRVWRLVGMMLHGRPPPVHPHANEVTEIALQASSER